MYTVVIYNADMTSNDLQPGIRGLTLAECHTRCANRSDCAALLYGTNVDLCTDCCWLKAAVNFSKIERRDGLTAYLPGVCCLSSSNASNGLELK
jgi:hypothetical protein